jgi:hypothetical protein
LCSVRLDMVHQGGLPKRRLKTLWDIMKVAGPAVVSVIALLISFLTYSEQRHVDAIAAAAGHTAYASAVSYWLIPSRLPGGFQVVVQNEGTAPISDVFVVLSAGGFFLISEAPVSQIAAVNLGAIPPCEVVTTNVVQDVISNDFNFAVQYARQTSKWMDKNYRIWLTSAAAKADIWKELTTPSLIDFAVWYVIFTDANGQTWYRSSNGILVKGAPYWLYRTLPHSSSLSVAAASSAARSTDGCS